MKVLLVLEVVEYIFHVGWLEADYLYVSISKYICLRSTVCILSDCTVNTFDELEAF